MLLSKIRMIKSEEEIDLLTKASRIVDLMFQAIMNTAGQELKRRRSTPAWFRLF